MKLANVVPVHIPKFFILRILLVYVFFKNFISIFRSSTVLVNYLKCFICIFLDLRDLFIPSNILFIFSLKDLFIYYFRPTSFYIELA